MCVGLNYKKFGEGFPLIILHGLFGSLDNWQTIAKKLSASLALSVYIIDQRNHGKSPHSNEFGYELLSADLFDFFNLHKIDTAYVMGHSMGGKTAMLFALQHPEKVKKLIVADVAPVAYSDRHSEVFNALFAVNLATATSRDEVEKTLREKLDNDETTVQFLMKGLNRDENGKHFEWKFNLDSLHRNYAAISGAITAGTPYTGETLFIKGQKSSYINAENYAFIQQLFPHNQLAEIKDAGHWVHAEKPAEFIQEVSAFLS